MTLLILLLSEKAFAAEPLVLQSTIDSGITYIDDDVYVVLLLHQQLTLDDASLSVEGPFRFRIVDRAPDDSKGLRNQDWDEPSDFARIIPRISYSHSYRDGYIDALAGRLNNISIGVGTLVSHYFNSTSIDTYKGGVFIDGDLKGNGGEFILDNIIQPTMLTGRLKLAPISWFKTGKISRLIEVGYTLGSDIRAPYSYNEKGYRTILSTGGDIIVGIVDTKQLRARLYTSLMAMDGDIGAHIGMDTVWSPRAANRLHLHMQGEYRYVGSDDHPALFNPFYEKNRWNVSLSSNNSNITLADHLSHEPNLPAGHGFMFEANLAWKSAVNFSVRYDREGNDRPHWILFSLNISPWKGYHLRLFYGADDPRGGDKIINYNALMTFSFRGKIWGPLDCYGHFARLFRRRNDDVFYITEIAGGFGVSVTY